MSINKKLFDLYSENWGGLWEELNKDENIGKYTNPFLICVNDEEFEKADIKVMFFGQETRGWNEENGFSSIEDSIQLYTRFYLEKNYKKLKRSSLVHGINYFINTFSHKENIQEQKVVVIWNNISKIGKPNNGTGVSEEIRQIERKTFAVVSKEVEIIKPDIIIFSTGPNRDGDITFHFKDAVFIPTETSSEARNLAVVNSMHLPVATIRLNHPRRYTRLLKANAIQTIFELLKNSQRTKYRIDNV